MKMIKRIAVSLTLLSLVLANAAAAGQGEKAASGPVKVTVWTLWTDNPDVNAAASVPPLERIL